MNSTQNIDRAQESYDFTNQIIESCLMSAQYSKGNSHSTPGNNIYYQRAENALAELKGQLSSDKRFEEGISNLSKKIEDAKNKSNGEKI